MLINSLEGKLESVLKKKKKNWPQIAEFLKNWTLHLLTTFDNEKQLAIKLHYKRIFKLKRSINYCWNPEIFKMGLLDLISWKKNYYFNKIYQLLVIVHFREVSI